MTERTLDINTKHRNNIEHREFEALRTRLTNINHRENEKLNAVHAWNEKKMITLANKDNTASLTELRTSLIRKLCSKNKSLRQQISALG